MSQQINLLRQKTHRPAGAAFYVSSAVIALGILAIVGYGVMLSEDAQMLRRQADAAEARLMQLRTGIANSQAPKAAANGIELATELEQLRMRADAARQLVASVNTSAPGSRVGFSPHFHALNSASTEGVWLTSVEVLKNGTQVSVSGAAVSSGSVMQYAVRLNETFRPLGVRFNTVEVTPDPGNAASERAPTVVTFKLS
jgi:hypothetical protein